MEMESPDHCPDLPARECIRHFPDDIIRPAVGAAVKHCQPIPGVKHKALFVGEIIHSAGVILPQVHPLPLPGFFQPGSLMADQPHPIFQLQVAGHPDKPVSVLSEETFPDTDIFPPVRFLFIAVLPA